MQEIRKTECVLGNYWASLTLSQVRTSSFLFFIILFFLSSFFFFFVLIWFELRVSHLLGRHSTSQFFFLYFSHRVPSFSSSARLRVWFFYLHLCIAGVPGTQYHTLLVSKFLHRLAANGILPMSSSWVAEEKLRPPHQALVKHMVQNKTFISPLSEY
jgi:hypothetical protein